MTNFLPMIDITLIYYKNQYKFINNNRYNYYSHIFKVLSEETVANLFPSIKHKPFTGLVCPLIL